MRITPVTRCETVAGCSKVSMPKLVLLIGYRPQQSHASSSLPSAKGSKVVSTQSEVSDGNTGAR